MVISDSRQIRRFDNKRKESTKPARAENSEALKNVADVVVDKPFKFSPFQVSPSNKTDFALARLDDLLNFARRVRLFKN
jgi:hypothetical protein